MIDLEFKIVTGKNNKIPKGDIILNNKTIHSGVYNFSTKTVKPKIGQNFLEITLTNKDPNKDTILENGKIVDDVYIVLENIRCQSTGDTLKNKFNVIGKMCTNDHNELKTNGYISFNGSYKIKFGYPFFVWENTKDLKLII